jgi:hypothetical protein
MRMNKRRQIIAVKTKNKFISKFIRIAVWLDTATETESKNCCLQVSAKLNVHNIRIRNLTAEKSIQDLVFDHNKKYEIKRSSTSPSRQGKL